MGDVVNLKRFKKRNEREASAKQADANRARFGRTKSERALDEQAQLASVGLARSGRAGYGVPENVANIVAFLLSTEASHVNGAAWVVDAGMTVP